MPKTLRTPDGIEITGIPDDIDLNSREVREHVQQARQRRDAQIPDSEYRVTAPQTRLDRGTLEEMRYGPTKYGQDGPWRAFGEMFKEGARQVGRGLGLPQEGFRAPDVVRQHEIDYLRQRNPVASTAGEITGQAAPLAGASMSVGALPGLATRTAASGILGGLEGYAIANGQGRPEENAMASGAVGGGIAAGMELLSPLVSRLGGYLWRQVHNSSPRGPLLTPAGTPTPEFQQVLERTGTTFEALTEEAQKLFEMQPPGVNQEQLSRQARFESQGLDYSQGNLTQRHNDLAVEARIEGMTQSPDGEGLRQLRARQSIQFQQGIEAAVDELGVPDRVGQQIKMALTGRLELLTEQKNALYKSIAENSPYAAQMPILPDDILAAMPEQRIYQRLQSRASADVEKFEDVMVEFGLIQDEEKVQRFIDSGREIYPLNMQNFDDFRQELNLLYDDTTPEGRRVWSQLIRPVIKALDGETEIISNALEAANVSDMNIFKSLQEARGLVKAIKSEFNPDDIAGRLIRPKKAGDRLVTREGDIPMTEASQVYDLLMRKSTPVEALERTVQSLLKAGDQGFNAVGDLQANMLMDALNKAMDQAPTDKLYGEVQVNFNKFYRELRSAEQSGKLDIVFQSNPDALKRIKMWMKSANELSSNARAMPKGSERGLMDIVQSFIGPINGRIASNIRQIWGITVNAGADARAADRALRASPEVEQITSLLRETYPAVATALGVAGGVEYMNEDDE